MLGRKKIISSYSPDFIKTEDLFSAEAIFKTSRLEPQLSNKRPLFFLAAIFLTIFFFLFQTAVFSIIEKESYLSSAYFNQHKISYKPAPRGIIFDKNGNVLATNKQSFAVYALPRLLPKQQNLFDEWVSKAAEILSFDAKKIKDEFSKYNIFLKDKILLLELDDLVKAELIKEKLKNFEGLEIVSTFKRIYPYAPYASHILGYVAQKSDFEKEGKDGIEMIKNKELEGQVGKGIYRIDALGNILNKEKEIPVIAGQDVYLTIDIETQQKLEDIFSSYLKAQNKKKGAAIALDPKDGSIIALASFPQYDNNNLSAFLNDVNQPLFNRVISGQYPSGSVIKPAIALAALSEKIIDPQKNIFVSGSISVPSEFNPNIKYIFKDWKAHGYVDMRRALAVSSNVYFYTIGGGFGEIKGLGIKKLAQYLQLFNFGSKTGIDLPNEAQGLVPTPEWKKQVKKEPWYIGDTYHLSIGQGDFKVTPLQIALLTALIANKGNIVKPHVLKLDCGPQEHFCGVIRPLKIDPDGFKVVQEGMRLAVKEGSAKALSDLPFSVAAKTGTAQVNTSDEPHSWFSAIAPFEDPQIVVVVLVENGGEGTKIAMPIVKDFLQWYFRRY